MAKKKNKNHVKPFINKEAELVRICAAEKATWDLATISFGKQKKK